jgi:DNA-binding MltR family transcriptional regulator
MMAAGCPFVPTRTALTFGLWRVAFIASERFSARPPHRYRSFQMSAQSNREALRRLGRKFPAPPEVEAIMDTLQKAGNDLSVAITATAILEATLERLLKSKFKNKSATLAGHLFLNRGPLMDFHSKILVAQAFGAITSSMAEELHSIKAIRNVFAHAKVEVSFEHELIQREVNSFKMLAAIKGAETPHHKLELSNKAWFLLITQILLIMFDSTMEHPGLASDAIEKALVEKGSASP